ncbi:DNA repair protein RecN [Rhodobacteraceae bacterium NNCM2]|nr:DNA repair protein RecN [Coraliihabitans acroporae]
MLLSLSIRNIVLIEALDLEFDDGLIVLTGETGAGKSILLDALGFALGRKSRRDLLRGGADQGSVTAVFDCAEDHPVRARMAEFGLEGSSDELILRRVVAASGRTSAFVNDQRASAEALSQIGELLVEVHGQHDDRGLLNPRAHRVLLDQAGGLAAEVAKVGSLWSAREAARTALEDARQKLATAAADADYLRHAVEELNQLAPEAGEDARLDAERRLIQASARIGEEIAKAAAELSGEGAEGLMATAVSRLSHVSESAEGVLNAPIAALDRAMAELGEAQSGIEHALEALSFDPGRLDVVEERLFAIRGLARKHNVQPDDLADLTTHLAGQLDDIDAGEDRIAALEQDVARADDAYDAAAEALGKARARVAADLDKRVTAELAPLKMETAVFHTVIERAEPGPSGADRVSFTAAINPGAPAGPIDRIASGGELSRFLLALKVCLAAQVSERVMIFDEIDRGVGGATAAAVGRRLARLAAGAQVLVVTHSPQVAAAGAHHWQIAKTSTGEITRTDVAPLGPEERVLEIARMLAGDEITPEARSAAESLMAMA